MKEKPKALREAETAFEQEVRGWLPAAKPKTRAEARAWSDALAQCLRQQTGCQVRVEQTARAFNQWYEVVVEVPFAGDP